MVLVYLGTNTICQRAGEGEQDAGRTDDEARTGE